MAMGKQLSKVTLEIAEKDKIIEILGKQSAMNMVKMAKMQQEITNLQGGK